MANFAAIANTLEGIINNQLNGTRQNQGVWEWYNALQRIVSQNRITETARLVGPTLSGDTDYVDVDGAATVYGFIVDNPNAAEAIYLTVADLTAANATPGTDLMKILMYLPAATMSTFLFPSGVSLATAFSVFAGTGTAAGLEGGTGVTGTNPTYVCVYTE